MPLQLHEPRPSSRRLNLRHLELARKQIEASGWFKLGEVLLALHLVVDRLGERVRLDRRHAYIFLVCALGIICVGMSHDLDMQQHRLRSHANDNPPVRPFNYFSPEVFYANFRFRQEHFHEFMDALGWINAEGKPIWVKIGRPGHRFRARTDWALMAVILRISRPNRQEDVGSLIGGARATVSETAIIFSDLLYNKYVPGSNNIGNWLHWLPRCVSAVPEPL